MAAVFWICCSCFFSKCVDKFWILSCHYKFNFWFFLFFWITKTWIPNYTTL